MLVPLDFVFVYCMFLSIGLYLIGVCIDWFNANFPPYILDTNKENDTRDKDKDKSLTSNKEVL